jgi:inorganic pyrophosphatase
MDESKKYLGQIVNVVMDRPLGAKHPRFDFHYPVNYGYVPDTVSGDGEALDAYILGVEESLQTFTGKCIAVVQRIGEDDDKLVVVPENMDFTDVEIEKSIDFQEKWFKHEIIR